MNILGLISQLIGIKTLRLTENKTILKIKLLTKISTNKKLITPKHTGR